MFEPLTVGQLTPVIAPYLMVKAIQGGYIRYGNTGDDVCEYTIDDTFHSEAYQVILSVDKDLVPATCEIFWNNRRILSIQVENFVAL